MILSRAEQRDLLTRTLARAIERHQVGELTDKEMKLVTLGTLAALDLLKLQPADARAN